MLGSEHYGFDGGIVPPMNADGLRALIAVLETGSLQGAGRQLDWPRATVTRRIDELEASSGGVLLHRTRRGAQLSELGLEVARRGQHILREMDGLLSLARGGHAEPAGPVRIRLPLGPPMSVTSSVIRAAAARFPNVRFAVTPCVDPLETPLIGADIVLHFGPQRPPADWTRIPVAHVREGLLASEAYAAEHGLPQTPAEVAEHPIVVWSGSHGAPKELVTRQGEHVGIDPIVVSPDIELIRRLALAGTGLAWSPTASVPLPGEPSHALVSVLPNAFDTERALYFSMPTVLTDVTRFKAILQVLQPLLGA